ncbi:MAG: hypothetical protein QF521_18195, partial [Alphaproteobacteria bacterium]|nr:hypothetical protein [Alphaproteobacteria bacterium]
TENLQRHFAQAEKDLGQIATSTKKITRRAEQIESVQLADPEAEADALAPSHDELPDHGAAVVDLSKRGA